MTTGLKHSFFICKYFTGLFFPVIRSVKTERPGSPSPSYDTVENDQSVELNQDDGETFPHFLPSASVSARYTPPEPKLCLQHRMPLEIYCKTDQTLICKQCATVEHQGHSKSYTQRARVRQYIISYNFIYII